MANMSTIEGLLLGFSLILGENLRTKASRQEVAREAMAVFESSEPCGLGVMVWADVGGSGKGVEGPVKESASALVGSEGGVGGKAPLSTEKLPHIKRCAPTLLGGPPEPTVDTDCFLGSLSITELCLDSGMSP